MASRSTLSLKLSFLVACILFIAIVADASVTWRKVAKPTSKLRVSTSEPPAVSVTKSSTRSPITWKRSTIARRSTDAVESREIADDFDELEEANSSQEEHITEQEEESEIKPLVPGSRPGFWFDSSRKKKPSSLLRPGTRRNSLFPTRSSTTTTSTPTTVSVAPLTVIPRTLPSVTNFRAKNSSSRISTRSTSSPIAFRKRLRTTKAAKKSLITEEDNDKKENKVPSETDQVTENEMSEKETETEDSKKRETEMEDLKPIRPKIGIRRRPYNSTRLSWIRQNGGKITKTTSVPQQVTTFPSTSTSVNDEGKNSGKTTSFPRTRTRSKTPSASDITRSRNRHTTVKTTPLPTDTNSSEEISSENNSKSEKENRVNDEEEDSMVEESAKPISTFGSRQNSSELRKPTLKTTVEPFYLTRDYGRIATALPELKNKKERVESTTQDIKTSKENTPTVRTRLTTDLETVAPKTHGRRKNRKRIKLKTTEAPKQTTTIKESDQDSELDYDYDIVEIDSPGENVSRFESNNTVKEGFESLIKNGENFSAKLEVDSKSTTTTPPVTFPDFSTIDPNSNAYVVWSVGHGGSGWSYQKHGDQVKWSAQNSEAEGDNWSVVSSNEKENIQAAFGHQWKPLRNSTASGSQKSEKNSKIKGEISIPSKGQTANTQKNIEPVIYMPKLSFENETTHDFKNLGVTNIPFQLTNPSISELPTSLDNFRIKSVPNDNFTSFPNTLPQAYIQDPQPASFVSQNPLPESPTLENEFNGQVEGIINQYPIVPNYPYVAEIRETYKNLPETIVTNAPTTKLSEIQKYVTANADENAEKEPTSPPPVQQIAPYLQEPQSYLYPQSETPLDYNEYSGKKISTSDPVLNAQSPLIPPELAKAVVEAKKWQVIGSGGTEGWSLLNEDGLLEWKIHNVDGQWKVTSAEQLKEAQILPQQMESEFRVNEDKSNAESYGYNSQEKQNLPKVWSLDDDYAKWRAVSAERGTPADVPSSEEISTSSQEYGYDSREYDSEYYSEGDYYNSGIEDVASFNEDAVSFDSNEDYGSRPLWGDGDNQGIYNPPEDYPQFAKNVEVANSREDAVAAWKSLVAQQGHWKFSENLSGGYKTYPQHQTSSSRNTVKTSDRRTSTVRPKLEVKQKLSHGSSRGNTRGQYMNQRNNQVEERELASRDRGNNRNHKTQEFTEEHSAQEQGQHKNVRYNEAGFPSVRYRNKQRGVKNKTHNSNYESIIDSLVQNYEHRGSDQFVTGLQKDSEKIKKLTKVFAESKRHVSETVGEKYNERNQADPAHSQAGEHVYELRSKNNNRQTDGYDSDTKSNVQKYLSSENENYFPNVQTYVKNEERNIEEPPERRVRININDQSKIESLITKLEAVQKEAKGRAVIDLSEILKHIKSRKSTTSFQNSKLDSNYSIKFDNNPTFVMRHTAKNRMNNFPVSNGDQNRRENHQNVQRDINNRLDTDSFDKKISSVDNVENNKYFRTDVRSINYRNQHLQEANNDNQKKIHTARSNNHSNESGVIKENIPLNSNSRLYPPARPTQQYRHERQSTTEKPEKDTRGKKRYTTSQSTYPQNFALEETGKVENSDSSSSEEIVVDLRDRQRKKPVGTRRQRRPSRMRYRRPNQPQPIVLKGETEVEEDGSRKNRKIIVIDYAGTPKKKTSVDKKDLELIIRNVKHRRSEIYEKDTKNEH